MSNLKIFIFILIVGIFSTAFSLLTDINILFKILLILIFCIFALAFIKPKLGLMLLLFVRPCLDILTDQPILKNDAISLNFASLVAILTLLFALIILIKNFSRLKTMPLKYNWVIFLFLAFISIFYSFDPKTSFTESLRLLSIFSIYWLAFFLIDSKKDLTNLIKVIIASIIVPSFFAVWQFYSGTGLAIPFEGIYNRIYGTFAHPNLFAYYLIMPLIFSLFIFLSGNKKRVINILYFLFAVFLIVILILTFTRGAWLSFLIIITIIGLLRYRMLLFSSLLIIALAYLLIEPVNYRVNDLIFNRSDNSIVWRLTLWNDAKEYIREKPLLGFGAGTAEELILKRRGEQFGSADPHNDYLKITIENGLAGLMAYLLIIAGLFMNLFKKYFSADRNSKFKILILIIICLSISFYAMSAADNILRNTALQWSFWAIVGAVLAQKSNLIKSYL